MAYDMYQERVLDHYKRPRNFGHLEHPELSGSEANPLCGDHITLELHLDAGKSVVEDVKFSGEGCAISMASASMLTGKIKGKPLAEVARIHREDVEAMLGVPLSPVRIKCALTSLNALAHALMTTSTPLTTTDKPVTAPPAGQAP